MSSDNVKHVSDASYEELIANSEQPVVVDFWAPWCGHCKALNPLIDEMADEYAGKAVIAKFNVDLDKSRPSSMGIKSIPTLILYKDGQEVDRKTGSNGKKEFRAFIDQAL